MEISEKNLSGFRDWLRGRGRTEGTAETYCMNLRTCGADPKGLTHRLIAGDLAPTTLRCNLASLRAWALYAKDGTLSQTLADLRLPPPRRMKSRDPLDREDWKRIVRHLQTCDMTNEAMRQILLIMALRGLRSGDVLRLRRAEVVRAVASGKLSYEGKGRKRIELSAAPIRGPLEALAQMRGWDRVRDLLGTARSGETLASSALRKKVWRAAIRTGAAAGIDEMNPHRYRHTFATQYLAQLAGDPNSIVKLQRYMHWESMGTAARYVDHVSREQLDKVGDDMVSDLLT